MQETLQENISPAIKHSDWLNLVIGPLRCLSRVIICIYFKLNVFESDKE